MKNIFALVALGIALSSTAFSAGSIKFGLQANVASLNAAEPLNEAYGFGYGGGAHFDITFVLFSFRLTGDYISFSPDEQKYKTIVGRLIPGFSASGLSLEGGRISVLSFAANVKLGLPLPFVSPYVTAGGGIANLSASDLTVKYQGVVFAAPAPKSETKSSVNVGIGVDLNVIVTLYIEAKYTVIFTEGESSSYVPVTIGITF